MKADAGNEQRFIADVDAFEFIAHDVGTILHAMEGWLEQLASALSANRLTWSGLQARSTLAAHAEDINDVLRKSVVEWTQQWAALEPAQALSDTFDDKVLLLVFGKFNSGKSAFCNLLADRFASHGKTVEYFHLDAGRIVESSERFKEGATETTARLQGVRLAGKLVLVDTPGLHSVTPENAGLTQRFIDSADAVLWLTSSTSPGQVQELDELGRELHRNKPLLPVITRSDVFEEDEVDGEIRKVLRSKTAENRAEQELDVEVRATEKLAAMGVSEALLRPPVSVSSYLAREQGQTPGAMTDAGFERLYAALIAITEPTLAYKRRKHAEVFLHHLEENVMRVLCDEAASRLAELRSSCDGAAELLGRQQKQLAEAVWRSVVPALPALLDAHSKARDVGAMLETVSDSIAKSFSREARRQLHDYEIDANALLSKGELEVDADFEDIVIECEVVGVDYQRLHAALATAIRDRILRLARDVSDQCHGSIRHLMERAQKLDASLQAHEEDLLRLKKQLRSDFR